MRRGWESYRQRERDKEKRGQENDGESKRDKDIMLQVSLLCTAL